MFDWITDVARRANLLNQPEYSEYLDFLIEVFNVIAQNDGRSEVAYSLLEENQGKLNDNLILVLRELVTAAFEKGESDQKQNLADIVFKFSNLIQQFPKGIRANNFEIAIGCNETILKFYTREAFPQQWAMVQSDLGNIYKNRIEGDKRKNIDSAIYCFTEALKVYTKVDSPQLWAMVQYNLGNTYYSRVEGNKRENIESAIACYKEALKVYNECNSLQLWALVRSNLGAAYSERIAGNTKENLEFAIECYDNALRVYTKSDFPVDWARIQSNLGVAYDNRIAGDRRENLESAIKCYESALRVYTEVDFPEEWAMTQNNLGTAYLNRIAGDIRENIESAIVCFQNALKIRTKENFPANWAITQHNLGLAFHDRIAGERKDNMEFAIVCFRNALTITTQENFPVDWAMTQNSLGNAYADRIAGNIRENLESAIICFQDALRVRTESDFPINWAETQINLGIAYKDRIEGNRKENLESTITYYQNALKVFTEVNFPTHWVMAQNNLGNAYWNRIAGDRKENLESAIVCFHNVLKVYSESNFPVDWAMAQNNLGGAYCLRIAGEKKDNIESAIVCFQNALKIRTQENFPVDWAMTQNNLGRAYSDRIKGDKKENIESALVCFQNALKVYSESTLPTYWATAQNNLGIDYLNRIGGHRKENIESAIVCFQNALRVHSESDFPIDWAIAQNNLGLAYSDRIEGNRKENIETAISCYQAALTIKTPETIPIECLIGSNNLGNLAFNEGNWQLAIQTYQKAISAIEITRNWATNDLRRQEIIAESMDVYEKMIQACINNGQLDLAIETTERSRARHLVDLMASNDLYQGGDIPEQVREYLEQYEHLQERINLLRSSSQSSDNRELATSGTRWRSQESLATEIAEINELETEKQEIWQQLRRLDPILAGQQQVDPISFTQIQQLIDNDSTAILCCYSTWQDTYIFILYKDKPSQVHTCKGQKIDTLHSEFLGENWLIPYRENFSTWQNNMPQVLAELAQRLKLEELIANHLQGIEELIIIPHLWLHQIPFAALPINSIPSAPIKQASISLTSSERGANNRDNRKPQGSSPRNTLAIPENQQYLGDLFPLRILPSCQILNYCHQRPSLNGQTTMGIVENASGDLPYTVYECETLTNNYQVEASKRLQGSQATVREYRQIASQVPILHSSHHGAANSANPLESALILSDGNLSLGELLTPGWRKDLQNLSDVYLNNCETNFSVNEITDDLLSIATGFLCAGARSVVSTLWSVDDCASALLAIFYYEIRHSGASRSRALQQAQQKLRNLTGTQLQAEYLEQLKSSLNQQEQQAIANRENAQNSEEAKKYKELADRINTQIKKTLPKHCQTAYPFASPFYWAGFISQGLV